MILETNFASQLNDAPAMRPFSRRDKPLILVAEDMGVQVRLTRLCLERANYSVIASPDGLDALARIQAEHPDLVLLDVDMPGLNGFQVLDALRRDPATSHIPVIMLTAHAKDSSLFDEWATSCDAFMTKPFSPQQLVTAVQEVFANTASSQCM
jgi:CheY-like chemotaxis protein